MTTTRIRQPSTWALVLLTLAAVAGCVSDRNQSGARVWYVQSATESAAPAPGDGSKDAPFGSLAEVEAAAGPGEEIRVLAALGGAPALDGGIVLQPGQRLVAADVEGTRPVLTNSNPAHRGGDAVTLADDSFVSGLSISAAAGHAVVGRNVQGSVVRGNRILSGNLGNLTSVTTGATAGLGVPEFPKAVVGFFHDETRTEAMRPNTFTENSITGLRTASGEVTRLGGAGIALHARGDSSGLLIVSRSRVSDLGPGFPRSGVLVDTQDSAEVTLEITETSVANAHESSDGILMVAQHRSAITANIRRYRYTGGNPGQGVGNNGLEVVTYYGANWLQGGAPAPERHAARAQVLMEESDIEGSGGFGIAVWNIFGKPSADTVLDFGGGELGGRGANRIFNSGLELPESMDVYVVHHDLNMANNWWGTDRHEKPKATLVDGTWQLADAYLFACPGKPEKLQQLIDGTGVAAWAMFCQALRDDVCMNGESGGACCNPTTDPARCMAPALVSSVVTAPALVDDPRQ